jgi:hypothetical protein
MDKIRRKQEQLHRLTEAEERWMKKLIRAANAIAEIRAQKKRLLKPRKLEAHESNAITGSDHHKIMDPEFFDDSEVLANLS